MVACIKPQQREKEESERLRGERDQIKFIDLRFARWQVLSCCQCGNGCSLQPQSQLIEEPDTIIGSN